MSGTITLPALGDTLPNIPLVDAAGGTSRVMDGIGDHGGVVFFMRTSTCPVCRAHVRELQRMSDAGLLRGASAIVITPGGAVEAAAVARRTTLRVFASGERHRDVGLGRFLALQHSGTFVVDASGRVLAQRASALPTSSFSRREILSALG
ncbi:redoxin domain-containing protein [Agromyces fucosus]|uniref:Redoxin domain-containing protein n=1 Tax=Agromyces fucosus TaxID=41985 RepID=A0A4Q2JKS1_9MICO|nr:redoxin domain-containing protein [Agromyces fucosus]RXZ47296.1 redoxin domain-containing protein [Agromyces fucosus]